MLQVEGGNDPLKYWSIIMGFIIAAFHVSMMVWAGSRAGFFKRLSSRIRKPKNCGAFLAILGSPCMKVTVK